MLLTKVWKFIKYLLKRLKQLDEIETVYEKRANQKVLIF